MNKLLKYVSIDHRQFPKIMLICFTIPYKNEIDEKYVGLKQSKRKRFKKNLIQKSDLKFKTKHKIMTQIKW